MTRSPDQANVFRRWTWVFITLTGVGCIVGIAVPAGLGWDFANFYDAGRRVVAGQITDLYNPLSHIGGQPPQGRTGFYGAPVSAFFYTPLAALPAESALIVFKIQNVLAFAATFLVLLHFYRPFVAGSQVEQSRFTALFAFLFLIYQPFWTIFRVGGQTTPTVLLFLALGLVAHTNGRLWISAGCVTLAALIKPGLAPAALLLACISGRQYFWRLGIVLGGTAAISVPLLGWPVHLAFVDLMRIGSQVKYSWYYNSSLYVLIDNLSVYADPGANPDVPGVAFQILTYALRGAVILTMIWLTLRSRRESWPRPARRHFEFSLALLFFLLWSPTIWEHYLSLLFPFLIYIAASHQHFSRQALTILALIFIASMGQNLILINWLRYAADFDSLPELAGVALFKAAPLLLTMVLLWRHAGEWLRSHSAPAWRRFGAERGPA